MLVDGGVGREGEEGGHAQGVVHVVVREQDGADAEVLGGEEGGQRVDPDGEALPCVDEEAGGAVSDEVGVCAWWGSVSCVRARGGRVGTCTLEGELGDVSGWEGDGGGGAQPCWGCRLGCGSRGG